MNYEALAFLYLNHSLLNFNAYWMGFVKVQVKKGRLEIFTCIWEARTDKIKSQILNSYGHMFHSKMGQISHYP